MMERFTDNARKVMSFANQEAHRFNHEFIGTEHILLGILKAQGDATDILSGYVNVMSIRIEVERLVKSSPEMITMGRLPQTPRVKRLIDIACKVAELSGHSYISSEHLLYGLLVDHDSIAFTALKNAKVPIDDLMQQLSKKAGIKADLYDKEYGGTGNYQPSKDYEIMPTKADFFHEYIMSLAQARDYDLLSKVLLSRKRFFNE